MATIPLVGRAAALVAVLALAGCADADPPGPTLEGVDPVQSDGDLAPDAGLQPETEVAPEADIAPDPSLAPNSTLQLDSTQGL